MTDGIIQAVNIVFGNNKKGTTKEDVMKFNEEKMKINSGGRQ